MATGGDTSQTKKKATTAPAKETAEIYVLGPARFRTRARILERAYDVLRLLMFQKLVPETLVQIRTPGEILLGEVRSCRPISRHSFEVALRVQAITKLLPGSK